MKTLTSLFAISFLGFIACNNDNQNPENEDEGIQYEDRFIHHYLESDSLFYEENQSIFIGSNAGKNNTRALNCIYIGYKAGATATNESNNIYIGNHAGEHSVKHPVTGVSSGNVFIGDEAGRHNTFGADNTFLGSSAGAKSDTGSCNTFVGNGAGWNTAYGSHNTFLGFRTAEENITGSNNVILGSYAGRANTGDNNVFVGTNSGSENKTGSNNVFIGNYCGSYLRKGNYNVLIGNNILTKDSTVSSSIGIGHGIELIENHQLVIGSCTDQGYIDEAYIGQGVQDWNPKGVRIQTTSGLGHDVQGGDLTLASGKATGYAESGSIIFSTSDKGVSGEELQKLSEKARITGSGEVGIGTSNPESRLEVSGAITQSALAKDPQNPSEGKFVIWMSQGKETGNYGDIMIKITANGKTKTSKLFDFQNL